MRKEIQSEDLLKVELIRSLNNIFFDFKAECLPVTISQGVVSEFTDGRHGVLEVVELLEQVGIDWPLSALFVESVQLLLVVSGKELIVVEGDLEELDLTVLEPEIVPFLFDKPNLSQKRVLLLDKA